MKIKFFDFDFEINDLVNAKFLMSRIFKIIQEKLNMTKLFIEPCISKIREDLNKNNNNNVTNKNNIIINSNNNNKKDKIDKNNKQFENMLSLVQKQLNKNDKKINEEDIVNYRNMIDSKDKDIISIMKEYKDEKVYEQTVPENDDDELNDIDNDEIKKEGKINIKESKQPNNFYLHSIDEYKRDNFSNYNNNDNNNIENHFIYKKQNNSNDHKSFQNIISFQKKNSQKNNLPKVNKK